MSERSGATRGEELLPCPFCGSDALDRWVVEGTKMAIGVHCQNCGAHAITAAHWNMRSAIAMLAEETARSETPRKYGFEKAHAVCILLCRDALLRKDYEGAYHWLYTLDSKQVPHDPFKPWAELEALAGEDYKPCKAVSYAPNGGASQEQRWHCEECGDVTDTDRCPKGRQNETLAKLASAPSPLAPSTQEKP